jgi:hypothetical protein
MPDFKGKNRKKLWLSWNFKTTVSSHFFKNLLFLAILSYLALLKSYLIEWKFFANVLLYNIQQGGKVIFFL